MKLTQYFFLIIYISITLWGCSSSKEIPVARLTNLQKQIDSIFNDERFVNAHIGAIIKTMSSNKVLYERNAHKLFMPASNQKILTASAALIKLGADFRFRTILSKSGSIKDSIIDGDVIVFGDGDPTLYSRFYKTPEEAFRNWAKLLKQKGIKTISGNIIGDDNAFDDIAIGNGWSHDGLDVWYSAEVSALQFNENYVDLTIVPPSDNETKCAIIPNVQSSYFNLIDSINISDTKKPFINVTREYGTNDIVISGNVKINSAKIYRSPSITNPTKFYVTVLKEVFEAEEIKVLGKALDCDEIKNWNHKPKDFTPIDTLYSPYLNDILKGMMKRSQNLYAETLVKTLGYNFLGKGTFENGRKIVNEVLTGIGINSDDYAYLDGSGLSRYNYVTPAQIVTILEWMNTSSLSKAWHDLLPVAGVDGTLSGRMKNSKAENNVHAKTGTISNVRGLSGYVTTSAGDDIVFSFLINSHLQSTKATEDITDSILQILAEYNFKIN